MKYHYKSTQHKANFLTMVCLLLFVAYSFLLYLKHQFGIVALTYFVQSEQATSSVSDSMTWISAMLGTFMSLIPAMILLRTFHFPLRMKALAFLPSYVVLGFLTGISPESVRANQNEFPLLTFILLLIGSAILIFLSQVYHEDRGEHAPFTNYLWANLLFTTLGIVLCVAQTNTDRQLHVQLALARGIHNNDYSIVAKLPKGETTTNNTITSMQVLHLSKKGTLADELFTLPYLQGSQSLLPDSSSSTALYHTPTLVYGHMRAVPSGKYKDVKCFLQNALARRMAQAQNYKDSITVRVLADYYLCALLLDRDLQTFLAELPKHYNAEQPLPWHYREALAIQRSLNKTQPATFIQDTEMDSIYAAFSSMQGSNDNTTAVKRKHCYWTYSGSYWNYYSFVDNK